jgi:hypothetical protein
MLTLFFAAAVATATPQFASPTAATASAQATVRIVRGVEIRFASLQRFEESIQRKGLVRERDGSPQSALLIEFY